MAKVPLAGVVARLPGRWLQATALGLLSAACELGVAAAAMAWRLPDGTTAQAAVFGAGAGGLEIAFLLIVAMLDKGGGAATPAARTPDQAVKAVEPAHVRWTFVVERAAALLGHVASRGLTWLAVHGAPFVAVPAVALFAAVDGVAAYGASAGWDWLAPRTWRRFYGFTFAVGMVELALFLALA